jgi:hypothetical protein
MALMNIRLAWSSAGQNAQVTSLSIFLNSIAEIL